MKANVHEFIVFLISISACSLVSRCSLISLTATSVGLWKLLGGAMMKESEPVVEHLLVDCQPPCGDRLSFQSFTNGLCFALGQW